MYSIVLVAALTAGEHTPDFGKHGGWACCGSSGYSYGTCYGACYGACYGSSAWNACGGGWGMPYSGYAPGYNCAGGCCGYYSAAYGVPSPVMTGPMMPGTPESGKKIGEEEQVSNSDRARLVVELPADAKLYVDDNPVSNTGKRKSFQTPALKKGQEYFYEVRAEVVRDGKPVSETRRVIVKAGAVIRADFSSLGAVRGVASAR